MVLKGVLSLTTIQACQVEAPYEQRPGEGVEVEGVTRRFRYNAGAALPF